MTRDIEEDPTSRWEKVLAAHALAAREVVRTGELQTDFIFWLGGVAHRKDSASILLLDLLLARAITPTEAVSEEPARWVQMIQDLDDLDGVDDTPLEALKKWRELSPTAQRLVVEKFEADRADRIAKGLPTEPTRRDRERLAKGDEALCLGEPQSDREALEQLEILHTGIVALQSTDDLGSLCANRRTQKNLDKLLEKHSRLLRRATKVYP